MPIDQWLQGYYQIKAGRALMKGAREKILEGINKKHIEFCRKQNSYHSSFDLENKITITIPCKYSEISVDQFKALKSIFGEAAESYFKPRLTLEFKDEALKDCKLIEKIIELSGGLEKFNQKFKIKKSIRPTHEFHVRRIMSAKVESDCRQLIADGIIEQIGIKIAPKQISKNNRNY